MYLKLLVFICGAAVMTLEIVASRFFAPYIGSSITVWTSLIGIVMAGLAVGYMQGGRLGDMLKSTSALRGIVAGAGAWILLLTLMRDPVLRTLSAMHLGSTDIAIAGSLLLLFVPSMLLGAVTPYAVRLSSHDVAHVGRTAGSLSGLSTIGSILGTFFTGFALVPSFGTTKILLIIAGVLLLTAVFRPRKPQIVASAFIVLAVLGTGRLEQGLRSIAHADGNIIREVDSPYSSIRIRRLQEGMAWPAGTLLLDIDRGSHAAIDPADPSRQVFGYTSYYRLTEAARPEIGRALLIGGGGYTVAREFLTRNVRSRIDVVEIDPVVTQLAREYFALKDDPRMTITHEDARQTINRLGLPGETPAAGKGRYQAVFGDAFRSDKTIPFHLVTREAVQRIADMLDDDGVYALNVIGAQTGKASALPQAEIATLESVFPSVFVFSIPNPFGSITTAELPQNIMLLATKRAMTAEDLKLQAPDDVRPLLDSLITLPHDGAMIFTDEYSPVEAMLHF